MQAELKDILSTLEEHGIRATANRILVLKALMESASPLTMSELEEKLDTLDKSSIFRTLTAFREHHLVHAIGTCDEGTKYEACHSCHEEGDSDEHVHFHCSVCHRTFCFEDIPVPQAALPDGFMVEDVNYVANGICPDCRSKLG